MADLNWEAYLEWEVEARNAARMVGCAPSAVIEANIRAEWHLKSRKEQYAAAVEAIQESFEITKKYQTNLHPFPDLDRTSRDEALQALRTREGTLEALNEMCGELFTNL